MSDAVEFDPQTLMPTRIEHFTIVELLGQGAMGFVFRARDTKLGTEVAIKMIKPELAAEPLPANDSCARHGPPPRSGITITSFPFIG